MKKSVSHLIAAATLAVALLTAPVVSAQGTIYQTGTITWTGNNGASFSISKTKSSTTTATNINVISFTCGTLDSAVTISPITSNQMYCLVNNSPTNTTNYIKFGNATSNYTSYVPPQSYAVFWLLPGGDGLLHVASSNATQDGTTFIPPR
jgi:hypothetical protein